MKKLSLKILALLALGACLYAQQWPPASYDGPSENNYWTGTPHYDRARMATMLGGLARYADVIGVGVASDVLNEPYAEELGNFTRASFTITVDYPLVGCTNGQILAVQEHFTIVHQFRGVDKTAHLPTNNSQIVFAVSTNVTGHWTWMNWSAPELTFRAPDIPEEKFRLPYLDRSWWYPDRDDGVLFDHFTNLIQAVRFDRNWTNYYHLVRDGANSTSNRVREDSFWELRGLAGVATDERVQYILDDPLVDPVLKQRILTPGWRSLKQDE